MLYYEFVCQTLLAVALIATLAKDGEVTFSKKLIFAAVYISAGALDTIIPVAKEVIMWLK
jgi:hypothetical protein